MEAIEDDRQLRAMVSLIEAQSEQTAALRRAVDKLEGLLALRAELDTMVAHEVRTPLTVVHGALATLQVLPPGHPDRDALLTQALAHAGRLSDVVKHLLTPVGEPAQMVDRALLDPVGFDVVVDRVLDELHRRCPSTSVVIEGEPDEVVITTSLPRLEAMLVHLLEHACNRAVDGVVGLRASVVACAVRIEVTDRGEPLADSNEELFRAAPGAMGLYLARMLARTMAGDVTIGDRPGGGCIAVVELPQRRTTDRPFGSV